MERIKKILSAIWQFSNYLFWPQWGPKEDYNEGNNDKQTY